jgi:hypothetical protein
MRKNKVLETYKHDFAEPEWITGGLEDIEYYAKNDPEELQNLISLFNSEKSVSWKLLLSEILVKLNYLPVKDFFLELINDDENKLETEKYAYNCRTHEKNKIEAAALLLRMNDSRGKAFFQKLVKTADDRHLDWIVVVLYEKTSPEYSSVQGLECLLELTDKYEKIATRINREEVETLLKRLRAGEKVIWERPFWD